MKRRKALKVIVIGDASVGKTSLTHRHVQKIFSSNYRATIGADFLSKHIMHNNEDYSLQIWDTAGQERFRAIGSAFYRGSDCCMIVFDMTNRTSFDNLRMWRDFFIEDGWVKDPENFPFVIVGNKSDEEEKREVSREEAENWCQEMGNYSYFETSAKLDEGVDEAFTEVARQALERFCNFTSQDAQFVEEGDSEIELKRKPKRDKATDKKGCC